MRALIGVALLLFACGDPVHDSAVEALGPEKAGVHKGPLHRPGQPCLTCHGGEGPASYEMAFGGTIYALQDGDVPGAGAIVRLLDANNQTYDVTANCVGNFWVPRGAFEGTFPLTAAVTMTPSSMPSVSRVMTTQMKRGGSCADCHTNPAGPATPGHLWVLPAGSDVPPAECSGDESVKGVASALPACPAPNTDCSAPFPTYASDVAPILQDNCVGCHQPKGQNSDRPLTSYKLVTAPKTLGTMNTLVAQCRMPPPPLDPLSDADRHTIACWIHGDVQQ